MKRCAERCALQLYRTSLSSNLSFAIPNNDIIANSPVTPQTHLKDFETTNTKSIPNFTIGPITPTKKTVENAETNSSEKYIDTIYEKIKIESFKETILQNVRYNIKEIFGCKFTTIKSKCEELAETPSVRYNKQIDHLQNVLKTKDKIIDQLLKSLSNSELVLKNQKNLPNSELESKNNIIHKLTDQTHDEENKNSIRRQKFINSKHDTADVKSSSTLSTTLLKTNLMKRVVPIVPRKFKTR